MFLDSIYTWESFHTSHIQNYHPISETRSYKEYILERILSTSEVGPILALIAPSPLVVYLALKTRGSQEPVIAHLVFNLTSKVDRKWGYYTYL